MKLFEDYLNLPSKFYYIIFISISVIIFFISERIYQFDLDIVNEQDARYYIEISKNPLLFFDLNPYYSSRILAPLLVYTITEFTNLSLFYSFKILNVIIFTIINIQLFIFFKNKTNSLNSFLFVSLLNFSNWVLLYGFFNPYQLLDLLSFLIIINLITSLINEKGINLFFWSILGILNKHYLIILIGACYLYKISNEKNYYKNIVILLGIFAFFYFFHKFAGINYEAYSENENSIYGLIYYWLSERIISIPKYFISFISENNIQILLPFLLCLFNKKIILFLKKYYLILLYPLILSFIIITMYDKFKGDNFSRIFYQSFYPIFILIYFKLFEINKTKFKLSIALIFCSILYAIEYFIFFLNLENNFVSYMIYDRYKFLYSPVYISSLVFLYLSVNVEKEKNI